MPLGGGMRGRVRKDTTTSGDTPIRARAGRDLICCVRSLSYPWNGNVEVDGGDGDAATVLRCGAAGGFLKCLM